MRLDSVTFCNLGSAGQPQDSDSRGVWVMWDELAPDEAPIFNRVKYEIESHVEMIKGIDLVGIPSAYAEMYRLGKHWRTFIRKPISTG